MYFIPMGVEAVTRGDFVDNLFPITLKNIVVRGVFGVSVFWVIYLAPAGEKKVG
jgi:hypothetical protein